MQTPNGLGASCQAKERDKNPEAVVNFNFPLGGKQTVCYLSGGKQAV